MLVSMKWLKELIAVPVATDVLAERLTFTGTEVESIERPGEKLKGIIVAGILSLEKHPGAENLLIAELDLGGPREKCVTAATNLSVGDRICFAPPGAVLSDGTVLGERNFKGVVSRGMMLSAEELGVPDVALESGILRLPETAPLGSDAVVFLGLDDEILDISITPNRGDLLSLVGLAREVYSIHDVAQHREFEVPVQPEKTDWSYPFQGITLQDEGCSIYALGLARDIRIAPSPMEARIRLALSGVRPINNIVDITNLTMLLMGQPLHAFDAGRLPVPEITVRLAEDGERLRTLDGKDRDLQREDILITSGGQAVALAGVMGGENSEIVDQTSRVLFESAWFDPIRVSRTSRRLGLNSEASYRFARAVDPARVLPALAYSLSLVERWGAGTVEPGVLVSQKKGGILKEVELTEALLRRYLLHCGLAQARPILGRLGFQETASSPERATFAVPSYRPDVSIPEDLVEEVARIRGYDDEIVPSRLPGIVHGSGELGEEFALRRGLRSTALSRGYIETVIYSFVSPGSVDHLRFDESDPMGTPIPLSNPISQEQSVMRPSLVAGFLDAVESNLRAGWRDSIRMFEIGNVFIPLKKGADDYREETHFGGLVFSGREKHVLYGDRVAEDFYSVKADVEALFASRNYRVRFVPGKVPFGHAGQTALLELDGRNVGFLARLKPAIEKELGLGGALYVFEFDLAHLRTVKSPTFGDEGRFPAVFRDISLLVPIGVTAEEVENFIRKEAGDLLWKIVLFDVYQGKGVSKGNRSLAYSLAYRHPERTLNDEEVEDLHSKVRKALEECEGYSLR